MTASVTELVLVALAAMMSPTTLTFCVLALVLGDRPRRTGLFFYLGAFVATLAVGVLAAFVLGDVAYSGKSNTPKTWVAVLDVLAAVWLVVWIWRRTRKPLDPKRVEGMIAQMGRVASSPAVAVIAAGATLANPGGFIPVALKDISELNPDTGEYILLWLGFTVVSLLPLLVALIALTVAPEPTQRLLHRVRSWLERNVRAIAVVLLLLIAASLMRSGIAGLTA